jgi:hypothetical protein
MLIIDMKKKVVTAWWAFQRRRMPSFFSLNSTTNKWDRQDLNPIQDYY